MHIRPVDIGSDDDLAEVHAVDIAANNHGRPYATSWQLAEMKATLRTPSSTRQRELVAAERGGHVVGLGEFELPLTDNTHLAEIYVAVHPAQRQQGVGNALVAHLRAKAEAAGRRLASAWVPGRQLWNGAHLGDEDTGGARLAGEQFARRCGMTLRNTNVHRVLEMPVDETFLDRLAADSAAHHQGYRVVGFTGNCPDEHVEAYCRLKSAMITEAPMGDLEMDPEVWDETRLREEEAELVAMGRTR